MPSREEPRADAISSWLFKTSFCKFGSQVFLKVLECDFIGLLPVLIPGNLTVISGPYEVLRHK